MTLRVAKTVLKHEAESILQMASRLDKQFDKAVKLMLETHKPLIVIGMGKPAFIAQKISASLASTGTPSFSLHPADALHGDIGRIRPRSVVLLLSNSGETEEIVRLIPLLKAVQCRLIAITGNLRSRLAKASHAVLNTSVVSEAEPLNVAPTASTTCMLAMGDALTMVLAKQKRFEEKDFARLHPGGALGRRLRLLAKDVMRKSGHNPLVKKTASVKEVLFKITKARAGSATVVDDRGRCVGIFTDGDLRRQFRSMISNSHKPITAYMTPKPITI